MGYAWERWLSLSHYLFWMSYDSHALKIQSLYFTYFCMHLAYAVGWWDCDLKKVINPERVWDYSVRGFLRRFLAACLHVSKILRFINKLELWLLLIFHPWSDSYCVPQWLEGFEITVLWVYIVLQNTYGSPPTNSSSLLLSLKFRYLNTFSFSWSERKQLFITVHTEKEPWTYIWLLWLSCYIYCRWIRVAFW